MKIKQSIKRGQQLDIFDLVAMRHTVSDESCRTNKPVNTIIINQYKL